MVLKCNMDPWSPEKGALLLKSAGGTHGHYMLVSYCLCFGPALPSLIFPLSVTYLAAYFSFIAWHTCILFHGRSFSVLPLTQGKQLLGNNMTPLVRGEPFFLFLHLQNFQCLQSFLFENSGKDSSSNRFFIACEYVDLQG